MFDELTHCNLGKWSKLHSLRDKRSTTQGWKWSKHAGLLHSVLYTESRYIFDLFSRINCSLNNWEVILTVCFFFNFLPKLAHAAKVLTTFLKVKTVNLNFTVTYSIAICKILPRILYSPYYSSHLQSTPNDICMWRTLVHTCRSREIFSLGEVLYI